MNDFKYVGFVGVTIDLTRYGTMMAYPNGQVLESFKYISRLSRVNITRNSEDQVSSITEYIYKTSAYAAAEAIQNAVARIAE